MLKVGDSVGAIYEFVVGGNKEFRLVEDKINKISQSTSGRKYYTRKKFTPLDADDVDDNTKLQESANGYIIVREVFGLNDITREKAEKWIEWANNNKDNAVSVLTGL